MTQEGRVAGFVSRFLALAIDIFAVSVAMAVSAWFLARLGSILRFSAPRPLEPYRTTIEVAAAAVFVIAYFSGFWALFGRTPGKALLGLKVVTSDGGRVKPLRSVARVGGYVISALPLYVGFFWVLVDNRRLGWHDHLVGTRVIYSGRRWSAVRTGIASD